MFVARLTDGTPNAADLASAAEFRFALRRFLAESDGIVRSSGLTPRRYLLLLALESIEARKRSATAGELAETLGLAQSTVTGLLDRSEQAGLVRRSASGQDARVVRVQATRAGKRSFARAFAGHEGERTKLARLLRSLGPEDA